MGVGKHRARVDANQPAIVKQFRALGCSVFPTHFVGQGFPDIVVGIIGLNLLVEIKDGEKWLSKRKLTDDEAEFHKSWRGSVVIVESEADVLSLVNNIRNKKIIGEVLT